MIQESKIIKPSTIEIEDIMSFIPPNPPWKALVSSNHPGGYLCFFFSDDLSNLPVRWITKPGDNKSDPNLETCTYGLFSTCNRALRSGVVKNNNPYIFFITRHGETRVLSGYYHISWYAQGVLANNDFCLAADKSHFVNPAMTLMDVDRRLGTSTSTRFHLSKFVSPEECIKLKDFLDSFQDASAAYLAEIDRLERFNLKHGGFRYVGWRQNDKFSWDYARIYFRKKLKYTQVAKQLNSAPGDLWSCQNCGKIVQNRALLKICPYCKEPGALVPAKRSSQRAKSNV